MSLIVDGATEKVLQFTMLHKSIYNKNFVLMNVSAFLGDPFLNTAEMLKRVGGNQPI
jgi:hypothetical protein